jgi:hypothetical protein
MTLTSEELADELMASHVARYQREPMGQIIPSCLIEPEAGQPVVLQCGWGSSTERAVVLAALRVAMITMKAARYAVWMEVWTVAQTVPKGTTMDDVIAEHDAAYVHGDLSADPNRVEAVFTLVVEGKGRMVSRLQRIIRGRNGGVRKLELIENDKSTSLGGALGELMPPRTIN